MAAKYPKERIKLIRVVDPSELRIRLKDEEVSYKIKDFAPLFERFNPVTSQTERVQSKTWPDHACRVMEELVQNDPEAYIHLDESGAFLNGDLFVDLRNSTTFLDTYFSRWKSGILKSDSISLRDLFVAAGLGCISGSYPLLDDPPSSLVSEMKIPKGRGRTIWMKEVNQFRRLQKETLSDSFDHEDESTKVDRKLYASLFVDRDLHGQKLKPIYDLREDYRGLDQSLFNALRIRDAFAAVGVQPIMWPAIERYESVVAIGPNASGKTLGYIIPILNRLKLSKGRTPSNPSVLILTPTNKACLDVEVLIRELYSNVRCLSSFHAKENEKQFIDFLNGCEILVATPPSVTRLLSRGVFDISLVKTLVIDSFELNFEQHGLNISSILTDLNRRETEESWRQIVVVATTWSSSVDQFVHKYLSQNLEKEVGPTFIIDSPMESAIYGGVEFRAHWCPTQDAKIQRLFEIVGTSQHLIVIWVEDQGVELRTRLYHEFKIECPILVGREEVMDVKWIVQSWKDNNNIRVPLIVTDAVLELELDLDDIYNVVHFSLPTKSKSAFHFRHLIMRKYFAGFYCSVPQKNSPKCHLLISQSNEPQIRSLFRLFTRVSCSIPKEIQSFYDSVINNLAVQKIKKDFCPNIVSSGTCRVEISCPFRHNMLSTDKSVDVCIIRFHIVTIETPSVFQVQIKKLQTLERTIMVEKSYEIMCSKLSVENLESTSMIENDGLYVIKDDSIWKRIEIYEDDSHIKWARFLDHWDPDFILDGKRTVYQLPEEFRNENEFPRRARRVILVGIQPFDNDIEWGREIQDYLKQECYLSKHPVNKEYHFRSRVYLSLKTGFFVPEIEICTRTLQASDFKYLKKMLLRKEMAREEENHLSTLKSKAIEAKIPFHEKYDFKPRRPFLIKPKEPLPAPTPSWAFLEGPYEDVVVTEVISPEKFYVVKEKFQSQLHDLQKEMASINIPVYEKPELEDVAVIEDKNFGNRVRAVIQNEFAFYVDYGVTRRLDSCSVVLDPRDHPWIITKLPFQAIQCRLDNVMTNVEAIEAGDFLYDITSDVVVAEIRDPCRPYSVALFASPYNAILTCVAQQMVDRGLAEIVNSDISCRGFIIKSDLSAFESESDESDDVSTKFVTFGSSVSSTLCHNTIPPVKEAELPHDLPGLSVVGQPTRRRLPEFVLWTENLNRIEFELRLSTESAVAVDSRRIYVRVQDRTVEFGFLEIIAGDQTILHEIPTPLILKDRVFPEESRLRFSKGRIVKLTLIKRKPNLWSKATVDDQNFAWLRTNFESLESDDDENENEVFHVLPQTVKTEGYPEAYFDTDEEDSEVESGD